MSQFGASVTPKEAWKLLKSWGFTLVRDGGSHPIWEAPSGGRVPISRTRVSHIQISAAAKIMGLTYYEFMQGPKRKGKK